MKRMVSLSFDGTDGPESRDVEAEVVHEHFAIHREVSLNHRGEVWERYGWAVSHIDSGRTVVRPSSYQHARKAAKAFSLLPVDWHFTDVEAIKRWPEEVIQQAKQIRSEYNAFS